MNFNTKLFFFINRWCGRHWILDAFGRAGAEWVLPMMIGWFTVAAYARFERNLFYFWMALITLGVVVFLGVALSFLCASLVREPRPTVRFPSQVKPLFTALLPWKSFPSDHALVATAIVGVAYCFSLSGIFPLVVMLVWVVWGRIYAGVHYPLDILGGCTIAIITLCWYGIALYMPVSAVLTALISLL